MTTQFQLINIIIITIEEVRLKINLITANYATGIKRRAYISRRHDLQLGIRSN